MYIDLESRLDQDKEFKLNAFVYACISLYSILVNYDTKLLSYFLI